MSVYEIVTERIIKSLESGVVPWQMPWRTKMPMNFVSKKPYRGINPFLLTGRKSPYWVSFKQMVSLGGTLKENDKKASMVIFWKFVDTDEKDDDGKTKKAPMLRYYNVFNLDQIEGIEVPEEEGLKFTPIELADKVILGYPNCPAINYGGDRAAYSPSLDKITMPVKESFIGVGEYYSTLYHEMVHSTGHSSRLNRAEVMDVIRFGSDTYAQEELVAEIGSSFLQAETGIVNTAVQQNSEAYIKNWIKRLSDDKKFVVLASARAQKAVDYILDRKFDNLPDGNRDEES